MALSLRKPYATGNDLHTAPLETSVGTTRDRGHTLEARARCSETRGIGTSRTGCGCTLRRDRRKSVSSFVLPAPLP